MACLIFAIIGKRFIAFEDFVSLKNRRGITMITGEDVDHIGWLASIKVAEEEKEGFVASFNSVLDYFHQLDELDTEDVEPTYRVVDLTNVFREDVVRESISQEESLRNAPRRENGYFKSPRIV